MNFYIIFFPMHMQMNLSEPGWYLKVPSFDNFSNNFFIVENKNEALIHVKETCPEDALFHCENFKYLDLKRQKVGLIVMGYRNSTWDPCKFIFLDIINMQVITNDFIRHYCWLSALKAENATYRISGCFVVWLSRILRSKCAQNVWR